MAAEPADCFLDKWHQAAFTQDSVLLGELLADSVEFHSPVSQKPYKGKKMTHAVLYSAVTLFHNFKYHREWTKQVSSDKSLTEYCLEFTADIDGGEGKGMLHLKGVDLITVFQGAGGHCQIVRFEVIVRPLKAVARLGELQAQNIPKMLVLLASATSKL
ncbi:hypothetical protein HDU83_008587 [Entophlyctis luteolus]|nr:hypothetical protein HDU83_008587 [Entophlyctis luteolus]KAJ3392578.1 hypothetical protein HDU84_003827 [Entophlyctis sp. JEL0112]